MFKVSDLIKRKATSTSGENMAATAASGDDSLSGKVAVVTGATSGIGKAIAHKLGSKGCTLVLTGLTESAQAEKELVAEFTGMYGEGRVHFIPADFSEVESTEGFCQKVLKLFHHGVDIFSSNAGVPSRGIVESIPTKDWLKWLAVNLTAPFLLTKAFMPGMKKKGWGRFIFMSSQMGLIAEPGKSGYCTVKAGLIGFARAVALEGAPYGITSNAICPAYVDAPMCHSMVHKMASESGKTFEECKDDFAKEKHPTGKLIPIEDVTSLVAYLCTDVAKCISGSPLPIDACSMAR